MPRREGQRFMPRSPVGASRRMHFTWCSRTTRARGAALAIKLALQDAERNVEDIDYINAHGTSTPLNDKSETLAIKRAFGDHAYNIPVSSTKSMTGHSLGASGSMEALACMLSIRDQVLHPTINLDTPDPDCDLDYIPNVARDTKVEVTLSNSFGFGGQNACLVIERFNR